MPFHQRLRGPLIAAAALAACLLLAGPASAQVFIEGNLGKAFSEYGERHIPSGASDTHFSELHPEGGLFGVGLGYHLRLGNFVVGPLIELEGSDLGNSATEVDVCPDLTVCATKTETYTASNRWIASGRLEAGYVVADRLLFIGAYGWTRGDIKERATVDPAVSQSNSMSATGDGPVWSVGADYLLGAHWSVGFRYEETTLSMKGSGFLDGGSSAKLTTTAILGSFRWYL